MRRSHVEKRASKRYHAKQSLSDTGHTPAHSIDGEEFDEAIRFNGKRTQLEINNDGVDHLWLAVHSKDGKSVGIAINVGLIGAVIEAIISKGKDVGYRHRRNP